MAAKRKSPREMSKEEVKLEMDSLAKETARNANVDPKTAQQQTERRKYVRNNTQQVSVSDIAQQLTSAGISIQNTLAGIVAQVQEQVEQLNLLREATEDAERELEQLHKIDVASTSLDQLVQDYQRREQELKATQEAVRQAWAEEQLVHAKQKEERDLELRKAREREVNEYEYTKTQERKRREAENADKQASLEKSWETREASLKEREQELNDLRNQVQTFPVTLQKEVSKAEAILKSKLESEFKHQQALTSKDAEMASKLLQSNLEAERNRNDVLSKQSVLLQEQLENMRKQVQEIATKAVEGAAGLKALDEVRGLARENAAARTGKA